MLKRQVEGINIDIFNHGNFEWLFTSPKQRKSLNGIVLNFVFEGINRLQSTLLCELQASYTQQSQRYVKFVGDEDMSELERNATGLYNTMTTLKDPAMKGRPKIENFEYGIPYEDARYILPLSAKTNLMMTIDAHHVYEFFSLITTSRFAYYFTDVRNALREWAEKMGIKILQYFMNISELNEYSEPLILDGHGESHDDNIGLVSLGASLSAKPNVDYSVAESDKVAKNVMGYGHTSVAEHAVHTFKYSISLTAYHQLIRHRHLNILRGDILKISNKFKVPKTISDSPVFENFKLHTSTAGRLKISRIEPEHISNASMIDVNITCNMRALGEFLQLRLCNNAQWEIRELAEMMLSEIPEDQLFLLGQYKPKCAYYGCPEGKLSCGKPWSK